MKEKSKGHTKEILEAEKYIKIMINTLEKEVNNISNEISPK
jgi:hypothetical protein